VISFFTASLPSQLNAILVRRTLMPSPSILVVLWLIEKQPSMYLGWGDSARDKQLHSLQAVFAGYALALRQHGIGNDDLGVLGELEDFLRERSGADNLSGIDQILATSGHADEAWRRVWSLINEFRTQKGVEP
jgi:hypothetical protein